MEEVYAKAVQQLITCDEDRIADLAAQLNVAEGAAKGLRIFWNRAFTGKCTTCGTPTHGAKKCRTCKRRSPTLLDPRSSVSLLREMEPNKAAYLTPCAECGGQVKWSAEFMLRRCRRFGFFRPPEPTLCEKCLAAKRHKKVGLTHRPFEELINPGRQHGAGRQ